MKQEDFKKILKNRFVKINNTLNKKSDEYVDKIIDNVFSTFERAAEINRNTKERILLGFVVKQLVCVINMVEDKLEPTEYLINEKIGDIINYFIILEAMFIDRLNKKHE